MFYKEKDFANTTRIIDKLVSLGYVEKRKSPADSRITTIFLMPKAETIQEAVNKVWEASTEIAMQGISGTEQAFLLDLVERMEQNVLAQDGGWNLKMNNE